ncbi:hypothetical protein [Lactobacillus sp. PSON]|uniref:hypothetical protein n=1 Tax=Lactobacillus sp. PSON TaxID=3455454 RepID=UPI004042F8C8
MNNKKITKMLKKTAVATMLTFATAAPLTMTAQSANAATYTASKYFPGESADTDNAYGDNSIGGNYFRNFKHRSVNLYVKDKKLKKIYQKAAKAWTPVFKFKFVSSAKHADFNSSKYANVVVLKDGGVKGNYATVNKQYLAAGSMKNLKRMHKDFPATRKQPWYNNYVYGHITNYKKWKSFYKKALAGNHQALKLVDLLNSSSANLNASKAGKWIPSDSDAKKHSWNHYITVTSGTRGLSQKQQLGNATETLGEIIGLGQGANPIHEKDEVSNDDLSTGYYSYKVTKSDLNRVDWIYAHPWSGSNYFWDNATIL